jgi:hypothetical protein
MTDPKRITTSKTELTKNWMEHFSRGIESKRLIDLKLIASHNSTTALVEHHCRRVTILCQCQDTSIYDQLCQGVRFLDFRYGNQDFHAKCPFFEFISDKLIGPLSSRDALYNPSRKTTDIIARHTLGRGPSIQVYLSEIKKFLNETNQEFLIIKLREEFPCTADQRNHFLGLLQATFGEEIFITAKDLKEWFD